jgi:Ion channel
MTLGLIATIYFVAALFFALIYWLCWKWAADAFIIHQEMNLRPFNLARLSRAIRKGATPSPPVAPGSLQSFYDRYVQIHGEETTLATELEALEERIQGARSRISELNVQHTKEWGENMARFTLQASPEELRGPLDVARFTKTAVLAEMTKLDADANADAKRQIAIWDRQRELRKNRDDLLDTLGGQRIASLDFLDFLYFSLGVSTTNTFGDIIPNSRSVRFTIIIQLIISLVLIGLFVNGLSD